MSLPRHSPAGPVAGVTGYRLSWAVSALLFACVVKAEDAEPQEPTDDPVIELAEPVATPDPAAAEESDELPAPPRADAVSENAGTEGASGDEAPPPAPAVATHVDLSQPVDADALQIDAGAGDVASGRWAAPDIPLTYAGEQPSLFILGTEVPASTSTRLAWSPEQSFDGIAVPTPVLVVNGNRRGPTLCLTAAVHGDELNGIEVVRRVLYDLDPSKLRGAVIGVPIVNLQGFRRGTRYLPDRRDLNRFFPGNSSGSLASRMAHSFFSEVIDHCDALVDLHTGSFNRTNLPQLRADLNDPDILDLTRGFGSTVVLHSSGAKGTLRRAASDLGIPSVTVEAGEPARLQEKEVGHGTKAVLTLLTQLDMDNKVTFWGSREPVYYRSTWVRADRGGVLFSEVDLGERVRKGQVLGTITDPITNVKSEILATRPGRVLGMALNQFVMPGFAAFRIGIEAPLQDAVSPVAGEPSTHTARVDQDDADVETEADETDGSAPSADDPDDLDSSD